MGPGAYKCHPIYSSESAASSSGQGAYGYCEHSALHWYQKYEFPMFPHTGTQGITPQLHIKPQKTYILSPFTPTDIHEAHLQKL